jgi:hypothetical protein
MTQKQEPGGEKENSREKGVLQQIKKTKSKMSNQAVFLSKVLRLQMDIK